MDVFSSGDFVNMQPLAVVPVLVGPLQALFAILPGLMVALGGVILTLFSPSGMKKFLAFLWSQKIAVAIVVAVIGGFVFVPGWLGAVTGEVSEATAGVDWPLWRGTVGRRGASLDADDPAHGGIRWRFADGGIKTFYASPGVVGNRLYVTSAQYEIFADKGAIYSIDADTGELVWKYGAGGYRATFSSPSISGKYLVVGEGLHQTTDSRVFCLDLERSEKERRGVVLWQFRTKSHVESSPCIADGKVCIGAGDDGLYCFDLKGGADGKPVVLWHLDGKDYPDCEASPVIYEGKVYFSLGNAGLAVCCVDAQTGKELWRVKTPYPVFGSPAIADGRLFVGMGTGNYVQSAEDVAAVVGAEMRRGGKSDAEIEAALKPLAPVGKVWCIDLATHNVLWKYDVGRTILGAVAAVDGRLYFGSRDKRLYCVSTGGELIGKWNARFPIVTSPAVGAEHVYVVTQTGRLYALGLKSLKPVWEFDLNAETLSSPAVARGHVYVGTSGSGLVCVGEPGGLRRKPIWAGALGGPGRSGWTEGSVLSSRGSFAWRHPQPKDDTSDEPRFDVHAPAAYLNGAIYAGLNEKTRKGLVKLELAGSPSRQPKETWFCPSDNPVHLSAAVVEGAVYFVDGRRGDAGRKLRCLDPATGEPLWSRDVATDASGEFVITPSLRLLIADRVDGLHCRSLSEGHDSGEWSRAVGSVVGMPLVVGDIVVVAVDAEPALVALDLPTGRTLWRKSLKTRPLTAPVFTGDKIWLGAAEGLAAYDMVNGEQVYGFKCGEIRGRLVCDDRNLACINGAGEVVLVDVTSGKELRRIPGAEAVQPPVLADGALLYYDGKSIQRFDFTKRQARARRWLSVPEWMGKITAPMIVVKSCAVFATDRMGLICVKPRKR